MKKLIVIGITAVALALTGCGASGTSNYDDYDGYSSNGGYSENDWDMNYVSVYNDRAYCSGGSYKPLPNGQYTCTRNGVTTAPSARPKQIIPPKSEQKPPAAVLKRVEEKKQQVAQQRAQQQKQQSAPKQNSAPKAPAAPKAPPAKSGK